MSSTWKSADRGHVALSSQPGDAKTAGLNGLVLSEAIQFHHTHAVAHTPSNEA